MVIKKLGGYIDPSGHFHSWGDTFEGYKATEMRYGFNPDEHSDEFIAAYRLYTEQLYPLKKQGEAGTTEWHKKYAEYKRNTSLFS